MHSEVDATDTIRKVIKFTRMYFFVFFKSVQVPLQSAKKLLFHFKFSVLYIAVDYNF